MTKIRLLFHCKNRIGLVRDTSSMLSNAGLDILSFNSFEERELDHFFIRAECDAAGNKNAHEELTKKLSKLAEQCEDAEYAVRDSAEKKVAVLVSGHLHCLNELLYRAKNGSLGAQISCIISNHGEAEPLAKLYGIKFHKIKVDKSGKGESEILKLVKNTDFLVLARYMQILSPEFLRAYSKPIINVHHSLLPTFEGGRAYEKAHERGVKIIGASAHFVTEQLDGGPIISQVVREVSHEDSLSDFKEKGMSAEQGALGRAVKLFANDRVISYKGRTFIL